MNIEWTAWRIPRSGEFRAKIDLNDVDCDVRPHRLFYFKLDLPISLLYFWRSRRKPTVVTLNHFGLYETICRHAKAFEVTLNHFTLR